VLAAACVATASAIAVATTTGATGSSADVVRLHLGSDATKFIYGSTYQKLTTAQNSCAINSAETLIDLESTGSQSAPGLANKAIGVKSGSSSSTTSCGQVDTTESLVMRPGTMIANRLFKSVRLDLEVNGNAVVLVTLTGPSGSRTYTLQTGTAVATVQKQESDYDKYSPYTASSTDTDNVDGCAATSTSVPNTSGNDNCQWLITPSFTFNVITLTTSAGTVALEGGGDFSNCDDNETLFTLAKPAPIANNDTVTTNEDTAKSFNVLTNDTSGSGGGLSVTSYTQAAHGTLVKGASGSFTYTPAANYNGTDFFTYTMSDGSGSATGTVNITINPVNDPPTATNDGTAPSPTITTQEDSPILIDVLANDTDADGDALTVSSVTQPAHGTTTITADQKQIQYTPAANYNGPDYFTYTITDGTSVSAPATVKITVNPVNDAPVAMDDSVATNEDTPVNINVLANDTDVDGPTLFVSNYTSPALGTLEQTSPGVFTYTPAPNDSGTYTFTYTVTDGTSSDTANVQITVNPVNDPPVAVDDGASISQTELDAGSSLTIMVLANDSDVETNPLTNVVITNGPSHGTAVVDNGTVLYTPDSSFTGSDSFTYEAVDADGAVSNEATVSITGVICTNETVSDSDPEDADVAGSFTRLGDAVGCKQFQLEAAAFDVGTDGSPTVLFQPAGDTEHLVNYRGFVSFGSTTAPDGPLTVELKYDPAGGNDFRPVPWCTDRVFDDDGLITSAVVPNDPADTWCIASVQTGGSGTDLLTTWQVWGHDDPKFQ
jgi:hypothetical protein